MTRMLHYLNGVSALAMAVHSPVQTEYGSRMAAGLPGLVATMNAWDADTRICETAAGIPFGVAVGRGTNDKGAVIGGAAATDFLGISIRDVTLETAQGDEYAEGQNMGVLTKGVIWVTAGGDVTDGADVTFNGTTGVLSSTAAGAGQFAITGARWMDTVSSGGLARVRLSGHLPAA